MKRVATLCATLIALLAFAPPAHAASICDVDTDGVFDGVAFVTAFKPAPDGSQDYNPDYQLNAYLTRSDGTYFSTLPLGYRDVLGNGYARKMLYRVDCIRAQDTVFTFANLEDVAAVTVYVSYYLHGEQIFTHVSTLRPGATVRFSAAAGLAQGF